MRRTKKSDHRATVRTDIVVNNPAFIVAILAFVMRLVENLFGVFWSGGSLCQWNCE
jgi:hypothetical protein